MLKYDNIKLFSFNTRTDILTDLNNYKDNVHYGSWINSLILKWMVNDEYLLTKDNYEAYLEDAYDFYMTYDYSSLIEQEDYDNTLYAEALILEELTGTKPLKIISDIEVSDEKVMVDNIADYKYLVFFAKKESDQGSAIVTILNEKEEVLKE